MTIFADASALVAVMTRENDSDALMRTLDLHEERFYCATGAWETILAVSRIRKVDVVEASEAINEWLYNLGFRLTVIGEIETQLAVEAHRRYGKGTGHPAKLNMGDCFAYACAKANNARLLYKGNDFIHTDLA